MKKYFNISFNFFFLLYIIFLSLTFLQSFKQDFTSIIDFDLTVIHNSLQLISNEYPDYTDHTAYSQFLINGIVYKMVGFIDQSLITNINSLTESENPEFTLQKLYIISRVLNSSLLLISLIFIFKILGKFNVNSYLKYFATLLIILSETFWANFTILRADTISICFFWISFYFLIDFLNKEKIINLFYVSFFMILSLLAKVQIIFLFMFMYFFFIFYFTLEKKNINILRKENIFFKEINFKFKYILFLIVLLYFLFQLFLNHFVNSSSGVGYFDTFLFIIYFSIIYITMNFVKTRIFDKENYLYGIFTTVILFSIFNVTILKFLNIINLIKIDFNIIFSLTNPFYFLKAYSTFIENDFSISMIFGMLSLLFQTPKFDLIYIFLLLIVLSGSFYKLYSCKDKIDNKIIYVILFCFIATFLIALNNFRYLVVYNLYIIPFLFISSVIFLNTFKKNYKITYSSILLLFLILNFWINIDKGKSYVFKPSNFEQVCSTKSIRDFYYNWARNFDEDFFKKICKNNKFIFK